MSQIEKLSCLYCKETFNTTTKMPLCIPCGHTYCLKCVEDEYFKKTSFTCQKCRIRYLMHYSKFPTNYFILNIHRYKIKYEDFCDKIPIDYKTQLKITKEVFYFYKNNVFENLLKDKPFICISSIKKKQKEEEEEKKSNNKQIFKEKNNKFNLNKKINEKININSSNKKNIQKNEDKKNSSNHQRNYLIKRISIDNNQFPSIYNYFEFNILIYSYMNKYKEKLFGKFFDFLYKSLIIFLIFFINYLLVQNINFGIFFLFISILYEPEEDMIDVVKKLKMFIAISTYLLIEDITYSFGLNYIFNFSLMNKLLTGLRTIINILTLGSDYTLNSIIGKILKLMVEFHLLIK